MMRTRAKKKHVASDRARRENVPRHILFEQYVQAVICFQGSLLYKKTEKHIQFF